MADDRTDEFLELYTRAVRDGEVFAWSSWWRHMVEKSPDGIDWTEPAVVAAVKDIRNRLRKGR